MSESYTHQTEPTLYTRAITQQSLDALTGSPDNLTSFTQSDSLLTDILSKCQHMIRDTREESGIRNCRKHPTLSGYCRMHKSVMNITNDDVLS